MNHKQFVLIVLDNIELLVHYNRHQQDAGSQTEQIGRLFNIDGIVPPKCGNQRVVGFGVT